MNATIEIMKSRRTCRNFQSEQITDEEINAILEAGLHAPSGMSKQSTLFIIIQDKEIIQELNTINIEHWAKSNTDGFHNAPTVIAVLANPNICHTYKMDAMAAVTNMLNAAESLGLGSASVSRAKEEFESEYGKALLAKLGIDSAYEGVEQVVLGYKNTEIVTERIIRENRIFKI